MCKRHIPVLLSLLGIAAIAQLLFFWLDPHVQCSMTVYIFTTCLTAVNTVLCFVLWIKAAPNRIPAAALVGSGVWLVLMLVSGILLRLDASVRTAVFSLSIITVAYLVCVAPMVGFYTGPARSAAAAGTFRSAKPGGPPPLP